MSAHTIGGVVLLNLLFLVVGATLLWALRGLSTWAEVLRLSGLAYLLGVAGLGALLVLELVIGIGMSLAGIVLSGLVLGLVALAAGRRVGRALPRGRAGLGLALPAAMFAALAAVYYEALFRSGRLASLQEWDAWSFWVPKAKAIYYFGGLDKQFFHDLPGPTYPPLVPALEAAAFHFMGSADEVTLHLQFWFLYVGFFGAVIGLLSHRVRPLLLWPFLLLMLTAPELRGGALQAEGDFLLDELLVCAALLVALWLLERQAWQLWVATVLLGGALLTKREGYLLAACVLVGALVITVAERRPGARALVAVGAAAVAVSVPWLVWFRVNGLSGGGPAAGGFGLFDHLDRAWPSLRLAVSTFFDLGLWPLTTVLVVVAVVLALAAGDRRLGGYVGLVLVLALAGFTWITWSFPDLPITKNGALNPIVRVTHATVIMAAVFTPMLLQTVWDGGWRARGGERMSGDWRARWLRTSPSAAALAWTVAVVAALAYPIGVLAGGLPRFPSQAECVRRATGDGDLEVVFGRFDSYAQAVRVRDQALHDGFQGTQALPDGCGRIKVAVGGISSLRTGESIVAEANSVGLSPTLERAS